jgi:hypothetical protein
MRMVIFITLARIFVSAKSMTIKVVLSADVAFSKNVIIKLMITKFKSNVIGLGFMVFAVEIAACNHSQADISQPSSSPGLEQSTPPAFQSEMNLPAGTPVTLIFADDLSSSNAKEGTPVSFILANSLSLHGSIVVDAGAKAFGKVASVVRARPPGRSGTLNIEIEYLQSGDRTIPLRATADNAAKNEIHFAKDYHLKFPFWLFRPGDDVDIQGGRTLVTVYVAKDVLVPLP